jgi:hypothetical protein
MPYNFSSPGQRAQNVITLEDLESICVSEASSVAQSTSLLPAA